jgi:hypothetical protein
MSGKWILSPNSPLLMVHNAAFDKYLWRKTFARGNNKTCTVDTKSHIMVKPLKVLFKALTST